MIKGLLRFARVYDALERLVGVNGSYAVFVDQYLRPRADDAVLDIGCGTGKILEHLGPVEYLGFDRSEEYIQSAQAKYGHRARFICCGLSEDCIEPGEHYDLALAHGVIHHLDDALAGVLFSLALRVLKPGGRLVTLDNVHTQDKGFLDRFITRLDRGRFVRTVEQYQALASAMFGRVEVDVRSDLLRIPYSHIIMTCHKGGDAG